MSETVEAAPVAEATETDDANKPAATETAPEAEATEAEGAEKPAETAAEAEPEEPKKAPWWDKRIAVLTAKNASAEQMLADANARLAKYENTAPQQQSDGTMTQADFDKAVEARAAQKAADQVRSTRLALLIETGNKEYSEPEFRTKSNTLASLGATENPAFMAELTESEHGHKIVAFLGDHPDEAARILAMPPQKLIREMAKLDIKVAASPAPKPVSKAAAPVSPVGGNAKLEARLDDPNLSIDKWIELRNKDLKARGGR
jgi:hypothetical protein